MNRLKALLITLLLILVFTGCEGNKEDTTLPTFGPMVNKTISYGSDLDLMEDVSANDNIDGDITNDIECTIYNSFGTEAFDINVTDVYTQICTVSDTAGNTASTERTITVQDELIGAVISGVEDTTIGYGTYFDPMTNLEIIDKLDGNITNDVVINVYYTDPLNEQVESVNTNELRSYYVDYIIVNSLDITTELRIQVDVADISGPVIEASDLYIYNDWMHYLRDDVTAIDEIYGAVPFTYTIYDSEQNVIQYSEFLYGEFTILYEAVDPLGNIGTKEVELIIVDVYPPIITVPNTVFKVLPGDIIDIESIVTYTDLSDDFLIMNYEITDMDTSNIVTDLTDTDYGFYEVDVSVSSEGGSYNEVSFYMNITTGEIVDPDLEINYALNGLSDFLSYVNGSYYSSDEVCRMYITDVDIEMTMSYEECVSGTNYLRDLNMYYGFNDTTSEVIDGITYFTTEIQYYRGFEDVFNSVTYHFVKYEYSWITHIVFDSDPFDAEYPIRVYNPEFEMIDNMLMTFYSNMLSSPTISSNDFCEIYVMDAIHNTMTLNECLDVVEGADNSILQYSVNSYKEIKIPFGDGPDLDGYEADINIMRTGLEQVVTVQFLFFEQGNQQSILFMDGFFSPDFYHNLKFINGTPSFREDKITEFYDALLSTSLSSSIFCETYYLVSPIYDFDLDHCISYVDDVRSHGVTYTINSISSTSREEFNGTLLAYTLDITFVDDGVDQNLLIDFVILENQDGDFPIFFDLYLVNLNYEEELNHAVIGTRGYPAIIQGFYNDVMDTDMSNTDFFNKYLLTGGTEGVPLTNIECSSIRNDLFKGTYSFEVIEITYEDVGDPEFPPVYAVDMRQNEFRNYKIDFTMYYNPLGELIIRVNLNDALGGGFE